MSRIPGLRPDVVPAGTCFLMASLQPLLHVPLQNASSSAPTLLPVWPNPTRLKLFTAAPKLCLVQIVSVKFCLCLFLQISHYCFLVPAPPLLHPTVHCTMIFSVSCITRTSLSPASCLILVFTIPGHCLPKSFPSLLSLQAPSSLLHQPPASLTLLRADPVPISFLSLLVLICVCHSSQLLSYLFLKDTLSVIPL